MQTWNKILLTALLGLASTAAFSAATEPTGTWYLGGSLGQSRGSVDNATVATLLNGTGATATSISDSNNPVSGKLFMGYQFNKYIAVEGGYFRLGKFSFDATTTPAGTLHGDLSNTIGWNLDAVGTLPIVQDRFLLLARLGVQTSKTSGLFTGTGAASLLPINTASRNLVSYKYGAGGEFDFTRNLGMRLEWERYRISDSISSELNVNMFSGSLLYRF